MWVRVWLHAAQTERGNARGGATKKREISCTLLSINLHFSVEGVSKSHHPLPPSHLTIVSILEVKLAKVSANFYSDFTLIIR